jgi:hypothetical protein
MKKSLNSFTLAAVILAASSNIAANESRVDAPTKAKETYCYVKKSMKAVLPYIIAIVSYKFVEKFIKDNITDEGYQTGAKEIYKCFTGIWLMDKIKNHAKYFDKLMGNPFDFEEEKAAA